MTKTIGEVCRIVGGGTPSKKKSEYYEGDIPWASVRDMNVRVIRDTEYKITKTAVAESATNIIPKGEVVISTHVGLGKVCVLGRDTAINQDLKAVIPVGNLSRWYLYYWFLSKADLLIANGKGATVKGVTVDFVKKLKINIPPLKRQAEVVAALDAVQDLIDNSENQLTKLDQLVKSRFVEMFGDLQTNNKGWSIAPFEDAATIDGTLEKDFKRYADYPHIGIDSIAKGTGELVGYRTVAQDGVISGKYHFTAKHIIYSKIRPNLNKVALPDFEGLCSADAYAILPTEKADRVYLAYVLRSQFFLDYIIPLSGRTGMPKANRKQIQGFEFPLPPLALQRKFAAFVAEVDKSKFAVRKRLEKARQLYRAKLQEYFG